MNRAEYLNQLPVLTNRAVISKYKEEHQEIKELHLPYKHLVMYFKAEIQEHLINNLGYSHEQATDRMFNVIYEETVQNIKLVTDFINSGVVTRIGKDLFVIKDFLRRTDADLNEVFQATSPHALPKELMDFMKEHANIYVRGRGNSGRTVVSYALAKLMYPNGSIRLHNDESFGPEPYDKSYDAIILDQWLNFNTPELISSGHVITSCNVPASISMSNNKPIYSTDALVDEYIKYVKPGEIYSDVDDTHFHLVYIHNRQTKHVPIERTTLLDFRTILS